MEAVEHLLQLAAEQPVQPWPAAALSGGQGGFAQPPLIQGQLQLAQILAGEFPGPLQHGDEGRQVFLRAGGIHGQTAFTVPMFDALMIRVIPEWKPERLA
jgi:hypothetical protein